jgi:penicillin-binding protein 2
MNAKIPLYEKFDSSINFKTKERQTFKLRLYALPFFIIFVFIILCIRLFHLTIVRGAYFQYISEHNRIREIPIEAPRGKILDRKGFTLAYSIPDKDTQKRIYNEPFALSHLIGYRQLASQDEINQDACSEKLSLGDKIGTSGLEKVYECLLRGQKGKKLIEINAQGKQLKTLSIQPPIEGQTLTTSIDLELQKKAFELMKDKKGSIIVSKPSTGEILAMVSLPAFDPTDFENNNNDMISQYLHDPDQPLFDRATRAVYPPGSVFKTVLAIGALEDKTINKDYQVQDNGFITAGPAKFGNWYYLEYGKTEGAVNVVKAIQRSNDIFFYTLGAKMGEKGIKKWANVFGYGKKTGFSLGDVDGLIPSPFWKQEQINEQWYLGDTYNLSIGQGYLQVTPLQVNMATLPLANGGNICVPKILKTTNTFPNTKDDNAECHSLHISPDSLSTVREGMKEACAPGGTGYPFFNFKISTKGGSPSGRNEKEIAVGCKTGTAEARENSGNPHAWFTAFAPFDKPEIAITVMIEGGGQGSDIAAPIAHDIFKTYFEREN